MATIEPDFIERLKRDSDIADIIGKYVELNRRGNSYVGLCPFHDEKTPSFHVDAAKQLYYCFGCGKGGDSLSFVQEYSHLGFSDAVEQIAAMYGLSVPKREESIERKLKRSEHKSREQIAQALLGQLSQYFQQQLRINAAGQSGAYLHQRGLSPESVERFALGYAPAQSLYELFPEHRQLLVELGLVREDSSNGNTTFAERLIFPIRDTRGRVAGFGGRALNPEKQPKYLNSKDSFIFSKGEMLYGLYEANQARKTSGRIVVCEGYMDVVMLAQHGAPPAVAGLGTALTSKQIALAFRYADKLIFAFDGDEAGSRAASKAMFNSFSQLKDGRSVDFAFLPAGEDPDSLVRAQGLEAWEQILQQAQPLSEYLQSYARANFDLEAIEGRSRCAHQLLPQLEGIPSGYFQQGLLATVRKLLQLPEDFQLHSEPEPVRKVAMPAIVPQSRAHQLLSRIASMVYANPQILTELKPELLAKLEQDASLRDLFELIYQICDQHSEHGQLDNGYFLGTWHDSFLYPALTSALLEPVRVSADTLNQNLEALLKMQQRRGFKQRIKELSSREFISLSPQEQDELRALLAGARV